MTKSADKELQELHVYVASYRIVDTGETFDHQVTGRDILDARDVADKAAWCVPGLQEALSVGREVHLFSLRPFSRDSNEPLLNEAGIADLDARMGPGEPEDEPESDPHRSDPVEKFVRFPVWLHTYATAKANKSVLVLVFRAQDVDEENRVIYDDIVIDVRDIRIAVGINENNRLRVNVLENSGDDDAFWREWPID